MLWFVSFRKWKLSGPGEVQVVRERGERWSRGEEGGVAVTEGEIRWWGRGTGEQAGTLAV
jgi:hypothetical protein